MKVGSKELAADRITKILTVALFLGLSCLLGLARAGVGGGGRVLLLLGRGGVLLVLRRGLLGDVAGGGFETYVGVYAG